MPEALGPHIDAVLREGLSNALRHAGADRISVLVSADEDVQGGDHRRRQGHRHQCHLPRLDNLTTRADECDGAFTIETTPPVPTGPRRWHDLDLDRSLVH